MEKIYCTAILALIVGFNLTSQSIDTLLPQLRYIESIRDYNDSTWTIITSDADMHFVNHKGELTHSLAIGENIGYNKRILSIFDGFQAEQDSFTYIITYDSHCDYWENELLMKVKRDGVVIDSFILPEYIMFSDVLPYPKGVGHPNYIAGQSGALLLFYDHNWNYINIGSLVDQIAVNDDGDIAVLTQDSIFYFVRETGPFVLSDKRGVDFVSYSYHDMFFTSKGELIFVTENRMLWFENELQNPEILETASDFKIIFAKETHDKVVIATMDPEGEVYAGVMVDRQVVYDKMLGYDELYFNDVLWIKDSLYVFTGSESYAADKGYSFLKTIDFGISANPKYDVALSDIKFNAVIEDGIYQCYYPEHPRYQIENVTVTITNNGDFPIDQLMITSTKSYCYFNCSPQPLFHQELHQMDLSPGESKEFYLGDIEIITENLEQNPELCLVAVQPNLHIDAHHDDNRICFSTTVSTDDGKLISEPTLFPNPVTDILYLSNYDEAKTFTLSSSNGIRLTSITAYSNKGIDMRPLLPGMYIVEIELDNGERIVERVVKL